MLLIEWGIQSHELISSYSEEEYKSFSIRLLPNNTSGNVVYNLTYAFSTFREDRKQKTKLRERE